MRFFLAFLLSCPFICSAAVFPHFDETKGDLFLSITGTEAEQLYAVMKTAPVRTREGARKKVFEIKDGGTKAMSLSCFQQRQTACDLIVFKDSRMTTVEPENQRAGLAIDDENFIVLEITPFLEIGNFVRVDPRVRRSMLLVSSDRKLKVYFDLTTEPNTTAPEILSFHVSFAEDASLSLP